MTFGLYVFLSFGIEHAFAETDVFQKQIHCKHRKSIKKNMFREKMIELEKMSGLTLKEMFRFFFILLS